MCPKLVSQALLDLRKIRKKRADQKKNIVATGYKQVGSRATPEAIEKNLKLLPPSAGPLDARKRALHDLSIALACEPPCASHARPHPYLPFMPWLWRQPPLPHLVLAWG